MTLSTATPVHFLLVDDLEENLLALEGLLRSNDLVLLKARSGAAALELLLRHEVALALIDVQMPEMDGFELAELMRGTERTRHIPIIFVTAGNADWQRRFRGYDAGGVDFIHKPIEPHVLKSKAEVFFELYRQRQELERLLAESRRQAAALQEADQRKDDFLAMLAHELRNPLAPVRNAVEILRLSHSDPSEVAEARDIISRQVSHMGRLIDDLLDVARISRGKMELRFENCDLGSIVRQTAEDYRPILEVAGIELQVEVAAAAFSVNGDAVRLAQVVGNLLHNARKFTPRQGRVKIRVAAHHDGKQALVSIEDSGSGMDQRVLARVFEPFSQANQSLDRSHGGLGLGLALAKGLVELHQGSLAASSAGSGKGSKFDICLPLVEKSAPNHKERSRQPADAAVSALRILVIEDNRDAAKTMQMLLRLLGHQVELAYDGPTGLDAAASFQPDIVFSDLGLPGQLNGYEVAAALRHDPRFAELPIIALSGYGQSEDQRKAKSSGFDQYLVKPVELERLKEVLTMASRRTSTPQQVERVEAGPR